MADAETEVKVIPPGTEGSLADIMDKVERPVFEGHPAMGGEESVTGVGEEETADEKAAREAAENKAAADQAAAEKAAEEAKPKHTTLEESDKAYREAERKMHEATTKEAEERRLREAAETRATAAEAKAVELEAKGKPPEQEAPKRLTRDELKAKIEEVAARATQTALETIYNDIDGPKTNPNYHKQAAAAWAKANAEITAAALEAAESGGVSQEAIGKMVSDQVKEVLKVEKEADRQARAAEDAKTEDQRTREAAAELATKAGIDMSDDFVAGGFWNLARKMPADIQAKPFGEQVDWAITETLKKLGTAAKTEAEKKAAALKLQQQQTPLERGATRTAQTKKEESFTLGGALNRAQEARRI